MKVLFITDTHHGCHNNDDYFVQKQLAFLDEIIDIIEKKDIQKLIFTGDMFDKPTLVDKKILSIFTRKWRKIFDMTSGFVIPGNHDHYYKTSNQYHMMDILFPNGPIIIDEKVIRNDMFTFVPWINKNNRDDIIKDIIKTNKEDNILCGHFDKAGANMTATYVSEKDSLPKGVYNNYSMVFSGHYHINQELENNWTFIGSPWEINRGDELSRHGVYVLDLTTKEIEFIENNHKIYSRITIEESECDNKRNIKKLLKDISGMIVDIHVNTNDIKIFEKVSNVAIEFEPHKLNMSYNEIDVDVTTDENIEIKNKRESEVVKQYLDEQESANEKEKKIVNAIFMNYYKRG